MKLLARLFLAFALIIGAGSSILVPAEAPACGCCDLPSEPCPCGPVNPVPASHRIPGNAATPVQAEAAEPAETHREVVSEARPLDGLPQQAEGMVASAPGPARQPRGREPDLGRHLARLNLLRI